MKTIAIIGGGFSGAMTAVNLARLSGSPLHITVFNKGAVPCRGIAYSTRNGSHLLNVVARNMSALADQPNHFVEWLCTRSEYLDTPIPALREKFVPRKVYGDYLQSVFLWYSKSLAMEKKMQLEFVQGDVEDIVAQGQRVCVCLEDGGRVMADKVVLAVGNQTPAHFRLRGLEACNPKYIANPWAGWEERLPSKEKDILLIGTGLTMVDAFLTLQDIKWAGRIYAVSRHGLLPLSHFKGFEYPDYVDIEGGPIRLRKAYATFMRHYREAIARDVNPAILVDKLRPLTQRIWQGFSLFEKRQFDRHFRARWNVVRHRIAPEIHQKMREAIAREQLKVIQGRLLQCEESNAGMRITVEGKSVKHVIEVGALVNCTGPREQYVPSDSRLFKNLFDRGAIQQDEMNMGIKVGPDFSVMDREGKNSRIIFALGSLLKGTLWESIAVPELRSQAFRLAEGLAGQLTENVADKSPIAEVVEDVLEYSI